MANIRISPDAMRGRASEYRAERDKISEVIDKMDSLLGALQGEWEGSASEGFAERYQELKPAFLQARDLANEISVNLDKTAQIMEQADNDIGAQFK